MSDSAEPSLLAPVGQTQPVERAASPSIVEEPHPGPSQGSEGPPRPHSSAIDDFAPNLNKVANPWTICLNYAHERVQDGIPVWKDEIANLLIFASLFSGVAAAFSIESYHNIKQDPSEKAVLLLQSLLLLQLNATNPDPTIAIDINPSVMINATDRRINIYNFLSLILSLSVVMGGILSLQWLRAFETSPNESLRAGVRWVEIPVMRRRGLEDWCVFNIMSTLPLLLLLALLLFFAGLIEMLLEVDRVAASTCAALVGTAAAFMLFTTIAPGLYSLLPLHYRFSQCPYKSPQSRTFHNLIRNSKVLLLKLLDWLRGRKVVYKLPRLPHRSMGGWINYDWSAVTRGPVGGDRLYSLGKYCLEQNDTAKAFYECIRGSAVRDRLLDILVDEDPDGVLSVKEYVNSIEKTAPGKDKWNETLRYVDKVESHVANVIVLRILECLISAVSPDLSSSQVLAKQRVDLFLRIVEQSQGARGVFIPQVPRWKLIPPAMKERVVKYILSILQREEQHITTEDLACAQAALRCGLFRKPMALEEEGLSDRLFYWLMSNSPRVLNENPTPGANKLVEARHARDGIKEFLRELERKRQAAENAKVEGS